MIAGADVILGHMSKAPINVTWFVSHLTGRPGGYDSVIASVRLRCLLPAAELERMEYARVSLVHLTPDVQIPESIFRNTDVAVFGKIFHDWSPLYRELGKRGIPLIADVCDDVFSLAHLRNNYEHLLGCAGAVTTSTEYLRERLREKSGISAFLVPDPVEGERRAPWFPDDPELLNLAWFGQPMNLPHLLNRLSELDSLDRPLRLDIVTRLNADVEQAVTSLQGRYRGISLYTHPWSLNEQDRVLHACHAVLIPSSEDDQYLVKSPNRLMASLWAGRPVVAHPLPSYREFSDFAVLNPSMSAGILELLERSGEEVVRQVKLGQDYVADRYSPGVVADHWASVLRSAVNVPAESG